ncbi:MAG: hypothetical protein HZB51_31355 [Chloroflexi bacterium]|nr:hypothetical protein [Chloroflexota bacterium]
MSNQSPIRKTEARVVERQRARATEQRHGAMKKFIPLAIVFLVAVFVIFVGLTTLTKTSNENIQGAIGPRVQLDREKIDMGNRLFNEPVRAVFNVQNVGDGTLKLETPRIANVLEGC